MAAENLVCKRNALAADENTGTRDEADAAVTVDLSAERALWLVADDLGVLLAAAEDHPFSALCPALTGSPSGEGPTVPGDWMMSSIRPYALADSGVRK